MVDVPPMPSQRANDRITVNTVGIHTSPMTIAAGSPSITAMVHRSPRLRRIFGAGARVSVPACGGTVLVMNSPDLSGQRGWSLSSRVRSLAEHRRLLSLDAADQAVHVVR